MNYTSENETLAALQSAEHVFRGGCAGSCCSGWLLSQALPSCFSSGWVVGAALPFVASAHVTLIICLTTVCLGIRNV